MSTFWQFKAAKQKNGSVNKGKWAVYRPDGLRLMAAAQDMVRRMQAWNERRPAGGQPTPVEAPH